MRTYFTADINEIGISGAKWNSIASHNETNTIFQTYQWFQSWWKVFGDQHTLFFVSVRDDEDVIGIAPLMISVNAKGEKVLKFVGDGNADYCDFIIEKNREEVLLRILDAIYVKSREWDIIYLNNIPEYSTSLKVIRRESQLYCGRSLVHNNIVCPTLRINGNRTEIMKLSSKYSLKRRYNYFRKNGGLTFLNIESISDAEKYMETFQNQHIQRWRLTEYPSLFLNFRNRDFYMELMKNIMDRGWLLFSVVKFNEHPMAFHYGFNYNSRIMWYKPSFDVKFKKHSPGLVLIKYLIEYALHNNKIELDFTIGDEPFKRRFTNEIRKNASIQIFQSTSRYLQQYTKVLAKRLIRTGQEIEGKN